jgi:hypothetical protein
LQIHLLHFREVFIGATDSAVPCAIILDLAKTVEPLLKKQQNPVTLIILVSIIPVLLDCHSSIGIL